MNTLTPLLSSFDQSELLWWNVASALEAGATFVFSFSYYLCLYSYHSYSYYLYYSSYHVMYVGRLLQAGCNSMLCSFSYSSKSSAFVDWCAERWTTGNGFDTEGWLLASWLTSCAPAASRLPRHQPCQAPRHKPSTRPAHQAHQAYHTSPCWPYHLLHPDIQARHA